MIFLPAYLRLLIFILAILIPACDSSSLAICMIYSAYKLNKQADNIQLSCTAFPSIAVSWTSHLFHVWYCYLLTCIQYSQETGKVAWYFHLFKNFPQLLVIHTVKGFSIVKEAEVDVFLEHLCFLHDSSNVGNLSSGSSAFSQPSLYMWTLLVHILLKPSLKDFEHNFTNMWNKHSCTVYSFNHQFQLGQAGFSKAWCGRRMRNKMQEFIEREGSGDQHHSKGKVLKLNPG